jgi:hypothetical protein
MESYEPAISVLADPKRPDPVAVWSDRGHGKAVAFRMAGPSGRSARTGSSAGPPCAACDGSFEPWIAVQLATLVPKYFLAAVTGEIRLVTKRGVRFGDMKYQIAPYQYPSAMWRERPDCKLNQLFRRSRCRGESFQLGAGKTTPSPTTGHLA